ncbi:MAG: thiamine-phosphate kinase [Sphingomonadaceae bacterium]|nr:thiamine-phosphate kinase [Sphingomonadaceae bacterium]
MSAETTFIDKLRGFASHPGARGLNDDAAVFAHGGKNLVLTHDALVENVHFLSDDPPADIGWKLVVANLSDLAAKGARPLGALTSYNLSGDDGWDNQFAEGLGAALAEFGCPLLGGDTVRAPEGSARQFGLTAIGEADNSPARDGAADGHELWVSGTLGDAGAGLEIARGDAEGPDALLAAYRRPTPQLALGQQLAQLVSAMMDISDGLLIDARRMAEASGVRIVIETIDVPLSPAFVEAKGDNRQSALFAATAGDDYELLFAAPKRARRQVETAAEDVGVPIHCIGLVVAGEGIAIEEGGRPLDLPETLGWEH